MPLPPGMDTGTVSFDFERADGAPAILGTLHLIPTSYRQELGVVVVPEPLTIAVTGGPQTKVVAATTDQWKYAVTEDLGTRQRRRYVIDVPAGVVTDLSVAAHLEPPQSFGAVVRSVNGVGPDADGNVVVAGGGGGGGGVASVGAADATILVTGTATNPKVGVGVIPESKVTGLVADLAALSAGVAGRQPLDADLTAIAALAPADGGLIQRAGETWVAQTTAQVKASLALVKGDVGLGSVDDVSDASKPVSVAQQAALDGKVSIGTVDAKGDLLAGTANDAVSRFAAGSGGQVLTADASQAAGLRYADPAYDVFPLSADGLLAAPAPLACFRDHSTLGVPAWLVLLRVPAGKTATKVWTSINTGGTVGAGGENSFALYDLAGTFVQQTPTNNNQWTGTGAVGVVLTTPVVAPSSADLYVYVGVRVSGYSVGPDFAFLQSGVSAALLDGAFGAGRKRSLTLGGSSWAGSINPNGAGGSGFMPFMALS